MHLNPVRAKLLADEQSLRSYAWSSYRHYLQGPRQRPDWLRVDRLLEERPGEGENRAAPASRNDDDTGLVAARLNMGAAGYAAQCLRQGR